MVVVFLHFDKALSKTIEQPDAYDAFGFNRYFVMRRIGIHREWNALRFIDIEESCMDKNLTLGIAAAIPSLDAQDDIIRRGHPKATIQSRGVHRPVGTFKLPLIASGKFNGVDVVVIQARNEIGAYINFLQALNGSNGFGIRHDAEVQMHE